MLEGILLRVVSRHATAPAIQLEGLHLRGNLLTRQVVLRHHVVEPHRRGEHHRRLPVESILTRVRARG